MRALCPNCDYRLKIPRDHERPSIVCPECGEKIRLTEIEPVADDDMGGLTMADMRARRSAEKKKRSSEEIWRHSVVPAVLAIPLVMTCCLAPFGRFFAGAVMLLGTTFLITCTCVLYSSGRNRGLDVGEGIPAPMRGGWLLIYLHSRYLFDMPKIACGWFALEVASVLIMTFCAMASGPIARFLGMERNPAPAFNAPPPMIVAKPQPPPVQKDPAFAEPNPADPFPKQGFGDPFKKKAPEPAAALTGDPALDAALAGLENKNRLAAKKSADFLLATPPNQHRAVVAKKLAELAQRAGFSNCGAIIRALGIWATADEVPVLIQLLDNPNDPFSRRDVILALGKLKDERAVKPLVRCFRDFGTRGAGETALREMGSMAEPDVLPLLNENDLALKSATIKLLQHIGTQQSVPALQAIVATNDIFYRGPAQEALAAIAARTQKK